TAGPRSARCRSRTAPSGSAPGTGCATRTPACWTESWSRWTSRPTSAPTASRSRRSPTPNPSGPPTGAPRARPRPPRSWSTPTCTAPTRPETAGGTSRSRGSRGRHPPSAPAPTPRTPPATPRPYGVEVQEVADPEPSRAAYRRAESSAEATAIVVNTNLYGPNPPGNGWWDVPVSQVSRLESTQTARDDYEHQQSPQRHYL